MGNDEGERVPFRDRAVKEVPTMADIDLSRSRVHGVLDEVSAEWKRVNEAFRRLQIPCKVSVECGGDFSRDTEGDISNGLIWMKYAGQWQVCQYTFSDMFDIDDRTPVKDLPAEDRVRYLAYVPRLYAAIHKRLEEFAESATGDLKDAQMCLADIYAAIDEIRS